MYALCSDGMHAYTFQVPDPTEWLLVPRVPRAQAPPPRAAANLFPFLFRNGLRTKLPAVAAGALYRILEGVTGNRRAERGRGRTGPLRVVQGVGGHRV